MELHFLRHNYEQATDDKQHKFQQIFTHFSDQKSQMQVNVSVFFFFALIPNQPLFFLEHTGVKLQTWSWVLTRHIILYGPQKQIKYVSFHDACSLKFVKFNVLACMGQT